MKRTLTCVVINRVAIVGVVGETLFEFFHLFHQVEMNRVKLVNYNPILYSLAHKMVDYNPILYGLAYL